MTKEEEKEKGMVMFSFINIIVMMNLMEEMNKRLKELEKIIGEENQDE